MSKLFNITKNTPKIQRLVERYVNILDYPIEIQEQKEEIYNNIKTILAPRIKEILAWECFDKGKTIHDININLFNDFIDDSIFYYLDQYNPLYSDSYYKPANFDTYYLTNLKYKMFIFLQNEKLTDYFKRISEEKRIIAEHKEKLYQESLNSIRCEDKPIIKLSSPIKKYKNILEAVNTEFKENEKTYLINIKKVCDGLAKTSNGYKWMYEEDYNKLNC